MTSILVLCTGNVCRSPIAEGLLRDLLQERFEAAAPTVASAGLTAWEGSGADPGSIAAAAELGVDISGHLARQVDVDEVREATVVLAMAREHRNEVARMLPRWAARMFTLKELVRLLESLSEGAPGGAPDDVLARRVEEADGLRRRLGFPPTPPDDDVTDPLGRRAGVFRAVAADLHEWCGRLVVGLFGPVPARSGAEGG
jgi:protein-tyrosine phosphatase